MIKRNGKVYKYGVSGGKVRKDGKSYRAEKQVRQLKKDTPNARWESEIIAKMSPTEPGYKTGSKEW